MRFRKLTQKISSFWTIAFSMRMAVLTSFLIFPALMFGQSGARDALSAFPADTQQVIYSNLAQLRSLPDYPQISQWIYTRQLTDFADFLRSMGTDPEKDVTEVTLGWRGEVGKASFFGLAEGQFQPDSIHEYVIQHQLPYQQYEGYDFYAFDSGADREGIFFVFFDSSTAAFGRLDDLKAILETRAGARPRLDSVAEFVNAEEELEGSASQWGIARGAAAVNQAAPWLSQGAKLPVDPNAFLAPIQLVLYRLELQSGFSMHMSVVCKTSEDARRLAQVLALLRAVRPTTDSTAVPGIAALFQSMDFQPIDSRVEISGSVPMDRAERIFRTANAKRAP